MTNLVAYPQRKLYGQSCPAHTRAYILDRVIYLQVFFLAF